MELTLGTRTMGADIWGVYSAMWTLVLAAIIVESTLQFINLRTQPQIHPTACRDQYWDISSQATYWVRTQPQAERLSPQKPLDFTLPTKEPRTWPQTPGTGPRARAPSTL